jgi:hypothetical protein
VIIGACMMPGLADCWMRRRGRLLMKIEIIKIIGSK